MDDLKIAKQAALYIDSDNHANLAKLLSEHIRKRNFDINKIYLIPYTHIYQYKITLVHYACLQNAVECLKRLHTYGGDIHKKLDVTKQTPLDVAAFSQSYKCVSYLIEHKCNVNVEDFEGMTPLLTACRVGNTGIARLLLSSGANVHHYDHNGITALMWALDPVILMEGNKVLPDMIGLTLLLLEYNIELNKKDNYDIGEFGNNNTALHWAAIHGFPEIVKLLIWNRADITIKNTRTSLSNKERTALEVIEEVVDHECKNHNICKSLLVAASTVMNKRKVVNACDVCGIPSNRATDRLYQCSQCKTYVHQTCYGIKSNRNKHDWKCHWCLSGLDDTKERKCVLCPWQNGASKQTESGLWVHLKCTLPMKPDKGTTGSLSNLLKSDINRTCGVCDKDIGACYRPCVKGQGRYHVPCSRLLGLFERYNEQFGTGCVCCGGGNKEYENKNTYSYLDSSKHISQKARQKGRFIPRLRVNVGDKNIKILPDDMYKKSLKVEIPKPPRKSPNLIKNNNNNNLKNVNTITTSPSATSPSSTFIPLNEARIKALLKTKNQLKNKQQKNDTNNRLNLPKTTIIPKVRPVCYDRKIIESLERLGITKRVAENKFLRDDGLTKIRFWLIKSLFEKEGHDTSRILNVLRNLLKDTDVNILLEYQYRLSREGITLKSLIERIYKYSDKRYSKQYAGEVLKAWDEIPSKARNATKAVNVNSEYKVIPLRSGPKYLAKRRNKPTQYTNEEYRPLKKSRRSHLNVSFAEKKDTFEFKYDSIEPFEPFKKRKNKY